DEVDIVVGAALVFLGQRVRAEECGLYRQAGKLARDPQHLELGVAVEAVAGFHLDHRGAFAQPLPEPALRQRDELGIGRGARGALLPSGWARDVLVSVDGGDIAAVEANSAPDSAERLHGPVLPGMANLHSHAFQRAMAGLTDVRAAAHDDFWSWRELMYQFMERLTPEQAHAIAVQLYIEMLKHGYTAVAEFHYVHHPAEMLARHLEAAHDTGIAITLLPALYRWSGFGSQPLKAQQRRFASDSKTILDLL